MSRMRAKRSANSSVASTCAVNALVEQTLISGPGVHVHAKLRFARQRADRPRW